MRMALPKCCDSCVTTGRSSRRSISFSTSSDSLLPVQPSWGGFQRVFGLQTGQEAIDAGGAGQPINFWRYLFNSVVVSTLITAGQVFFSAMAAYAFARLQWKYRERVFAFFLAGLMIPSIFTSLGETDARRRGLDDRQAAVESKRRAAGVIGIVGAVGAFGGVLIHVVLRQASLDVSALVKAAATPAEKVAIAATHADWSIPALRLFLASYVVFAAVTWVAYLRAGSTFGTEPEREGEHASMAGAAA